MRGNEVWLLWTWGDVVQFWVQFQMDLLKKSIMDRGGAHNFPQCYRQPMVALMVAQGGEHISQCCGHWSAALGPVSNPHECSHKQP